MRKLFSILSILILVIGVHACNWDQGDGENSKDEGDQIEKPDPDADSSQAEEKTPPEEPPAENPDDEDPPTDDAAAATTEPGDERGSQLPLVITTTSQTLPICSVYEPFSHPMVADGGTRQGYSWNATNLPPGLTIDSTTGLISGTVSVEKTYSGITVSVADSAGETKSVAFADLTCALDMEVNLFVEEANGTETPITSSIQREFAYPHVESLIVKVKGGKGPFNIQLSGIGGVEKFEKSDVSTSQRSDEETNLVSVYKLHFENRADEKRFNPKVFINLGVMVKDVSGNERTGSIGNLTYQGKTPLSILVDGNGEKTELNDATFPIEYSGNEISASGGLSSPTGGYAFSFKFYRIPESKENNLAAVSDDEKTEIPNFPKGIEPETNEGEYVVTTRLTGTPVAEDMCEPLPDTMFCAVEVTATDSEQDSAKKLFNCRLYFWHAGLAADQNNLVNVGRFKG